uniref:Uncharacterized protein n=1 Tax=Ananas comosus var. bracteatus TaxID=296719 RepID=A0A6V7NJS5_ANACO|nr:unnamed protein product [Ananas comosus var. bracteatus]
MKATLGRPGAAPTLLLFPAGAAPTLQEHLLRRCRRRGGRGGNAAHERGRRPSRDRACAVLLRQAQREQPRTPARAAVVPRLSTNATSPSITPLADPSTARGAAAAATTIAAALARASGVGERHRPPSSGSRFCRSATAAASSSHPTPTIASTPIASASKSESLLPRTRSPPSPTSSPASPLPRRSSPTPAPAPGAAAPPRPSPSPLMTTTTRVWPGRVGGGGGKGRRVAWGWGYARREGGCRGKEGLVLKGMLDLINFVARFVVFDATKTCLIHDPEEIMAFFGDVLVN